MEALISIFFLSTLTFLILFLINKRRVDKLKNSNSEYQKQIKEKENQFKSLNEEYKEYSEIKDINEELKKLDNEKEDFKLKYQAAQEKYKELLSTIDLYEEKLEGFSFGIYDPIFNLDDSIAYKSAIKKNRDEQKDYVRNNKACECFTDWELSGSKAEGKKFTNRIIKMSLKAFNGECDSLIGKVKWNNINQFEGRIFKAFDSINKLNEIAHVEIRDKYLDLKLEELKLVHEYKLKLQEEKEEQREIKERMREEERAKREYEKAQRDAEREELQYQKALEKARKELETASDENKLKLEAELEKLKAELEEAHNRKERAISMAQQTRRGYVYVISNIGSFGENIFKIGMTRRLEPMDRVKELGDASVPFIFDVHAMIFSKDAPSLEKELHNVFESKRTNMVNYRKEFFNVSIEDIIEEVEKISDAEIEFTKLAEAKEYRETIEKAKELSKAINKDEVGEENQFLEELDL